MEGDCSEWDHFYKYGLSLPFDDIKFTSLTVSMAYDKIQYVLEPHRIDSVSCEEADKVEKIVDSLNSNQGLKVQCGGHEWKVGACRTYMALCVDCQRVCDSCPGSTFLVSPCREGCPYQANENSYGILKFDASKVPLNPIVTMVPELMEYRAEENSVDLHVSISKAGTIYCGALQSNVVLSSTYQVVNAKLRAMVVVEDDAHFQNITLTLQNLAPDQRYNIYCFAQDFAGHAMDVQDVLETELSLETDECSMQALSLDINPNAYVTPTNSPEFHVSVNILPLSSMSVQLEARVCASWQNVPDSNGTLVEKIWVEGPLVSNFFKPALHNFYSDSSSLSSGFLISYSVPGCYAINATVIHTTGCPYKHVSAEINIVEETASPPPPQLTLIRFSNDGRLLHFAFDAETNIGGTAFEIGKYFVCSAMFIFAGSDNTNCYWNSTKFVIANVYEANELRIDDPVLFRGRPVRAYCDENSPFQCNKLMYSSLLNSVAAAPINPIQPRPSLFSENINLCNDLVLDPTQSTGDGGRRWDSMYWRVVCQNDDKANMTLLEMYMNNYFSSTESIIVIPNEELYRYYPYYLSCTLVKFTMSVVNFMGKVGVISTTTSISKEKKAPVAAVSYPINIYAWQTATFYATGSVSICNEAKTTEDLSYSWFVYQGNVRMTDITSSSPDPRTFIVSPYSFRANQVYSVQTVVSLVSAQAILTSVMSNVQVVQSELTVAITGVEARNISNIERVYMDAATHTFDPDSADRGVAITNLQFQWSCYEESPNYGGGCSDSQMMGRTSSQISIAPGDIAAGRNFVYTVLVTSTDGRQGSATQKLSVYSMPSPELACSPPPAKFNALEKLIINCTLTGSHSSSNVTLLSDELDEEQLREISLIPLYQMVQPGIHLVQIAISAGTLLERATYTFQLASVYTDNTLGGVESMAAVRVVINQPPSGGIFSVVPSSGVAIQEKFYFSSNGWTDDPEDYPLSYAMGYFGVDESQIITVKGMSTLSSTNAYLGQGLEGTNFYVTAVLKTADYFGSSTKRYQPIQVMPPASIDVDQLNVQLADASQIGNVDDTFQVVAAAATAATTVECVYANPAICANYNRQICSKVPNTCGACLEGFIGADGHANLVCIPVSNAGINRRRLHLAHLVANKYEPRILQEHIQNGIAGAYCTRGTQCFSGVCEASFTCADAFITCPNNCGNFDCRYVRDSGISSNPCHITELNCLPQCMCGDLIQNMVVLDTFGGVDCSLNGQQQSEKRALNELVCSNLYVISTTQVGSDDVLISRATTVESVLNDRSLVTAASAMYCAMAIIETISNDYTSLGKLPDAFEPLTRAISTLLSIDLLDNYLMDQLVHSLDQLMLGIQSPLALDEPAVEIVSTNIRVKVAKGGVSALDQPFELPQSSIEVLYEVQPTSISLSDLKISSEDRPQVGVSLIQYNYTRLPNQTNVNLTLQGYDLSISSFTTSTVLQNAYLIQYDPIEDPPRFEQCFPAEKPYNVSYNCSATDFHDFSEFNFTCPGIVGGFFHYKCPGDLSYPVCTADISSSYKSECSSREYFITDVYGDQRSFFAQNVTDFTDATTTCVCTHSVVSSSLSSKIVISVESTRHTEQWNFTDIFDSYEIPQVEYDIMVAAVAAFSLAILFLNTFSKIFYDKSNDDDIFNDEDDKKDDDADPLALKKDLGSFVARKDPLPALRATERLENIDNESKLEDAPEDVPYDEIFYQAISQEVYKEEWMKIFLSHLHLCHTWFVNSSRRRYERVTDSIILLFSTLNLLISTCVTVVLFYADNGQCQQHLDEDHCIEHQGILQMFRDEPMCVWSSDYGFCTFEPPVNRFALVLSRLVTTFLINIVICSHAIFF